MPHLYEIHLLDRKEMGQLPWKYSGSSYNDRPLYFGSSCHPEYKAHLKISLSMKMVKKSIIEKYDKNIISPKELRIKESLWQKDNGHKHNDEYYNKSDSIHPVSDNPISREKISNTLKRKGITPYSSKTHSHEALSKARATKELKGFKWYYCPQTLESKMFAVKIGDVPPTSWLSGKKPKLKYNKKPLGQRWEVYKNGNKIWEGQNLKKWSTENSLIGLPYNIHLYKKREIASIHIISRSNVTNTILFDGHDTGLLQYQFSILHECSSSYISTIINGTGIFYKYCIAEYNAIKIKER
jgi:hypothetical protein